MGRYVSRRVCVWKRIQRPCLGLDLGLSLSSGCRCVCLRARVPEPASAPVPGKRFACLLIRLHRSVCRSRICQLLLAFSYQPTYQPTYLPMTARSPLLCGDWRGDWQPQAKGNMQQVGRQAVHAPLAAARRTSLSRSAEHEACLPTHLVIQ
ncbi:uncharacterized protein K452DRAFT_59485 [Aplosporella prunicola CBS 121167]|uniref:Uncharacterized protein n=1 Tax=Aplosporella prunicola CBS 121167 TaxID=1176127 RepID=A0A6A6B8X7_9PEZI|nr:uncharacterized protein K452DRAFT_59485 [Aplosporella prunicola CBS 121167]KAF2140018.1 hypothetical protein K452DRAFT_59485 [Aplosporella prunicola CBS 121167]